MMSYPENKSEKTTCGGFYDQEQNQGATCMEDQDGKNLWDIFELLQIDVDSESSRDQVTSNKNLCSRNVLRKQRHWEKIVSAKKSKRKLERERRKAKHAEEKEDSNFGVQSCFVWTPLELNRFHVIRVEKIHRAFFDSVPQVSKRELKAIAKEHLLDAKETGPWLCIDLSMTNHMTKKEISRLAIQIRRLYGSNKKSWRPFWLYLTGFVENSPISEACLRMNDGFANYLMDVTPESYLDLFPLETIVYLTPDAENALEEVDPRKVYILGGLVDESIQKRLTLHKAQEEHLQTARLPIQEYMVKNINAKNYHSTTLAINQVFDALSVFYVTKSWEEALKAAVSPGKGYVLRDATL